MTIIHHGIDTDFFRPDRHDRMTIRQELGITKDDQVVTFIGHFDIRKHPEMVIQLFEKVYDKLPRLHCILLGRGDREAELQAMAAKIPQHDRIHFLPHQPTTGPVLAASDLLFLPSESESFGLVLAEAMAMGVPPVAFQVDAIPEVVGDAGRLFSFGDLAGVCNATIELLTDDARRRQLGEQGRARVEREFAASTMATNLRSYLQTIR